MSLHGPDMAVGVGPVRAEILVGFLCLTFTLLLSIYLLWTMVVASFEASRDYFETSVITVVAVPGLAYLTVLPGRAGAGLRNNGRAGQAVDRVKALEATYLWSRGAAAPGGHGQRGGGCVAVGPCRCDRRGGSMAAGPVRRSPGHRRELCPADRRAQLRGSSAATCQGRAHR